MSFSSVALSGAWTLYIVGNSIAGQNFALGGPTNGYIGYYNSGGSYVVDDVNFSPNYPGNATTRSVVIRAHRSGAGANVGYKTTGVSELSQSSTLGTITISEIMRRASPAIACAGDVGEVILYNTDLSTTDKSSVEAYILSKWGVAT